MGLTTFQCVDLSISLEAIGSQLPSVWEIAHVGFCLVQKVVLTPVVSLIHTSKVQGTRGLLQKGFLQRLGLHNCLSQTRKDNSIYTCLFTQATCLECGGYMQKQLNLSIQHKNVPNSYINNKNCPNERSLSLSTRLARVGTCQTRVLHSSATS